MQRSSGCDISTKGSRSESTRCVVRRLEADGWYLDRTRGSHLQFKHSVKQGMVTVPGKLSKDVAPSTLNNIWKQAQLQRED